MQTGRSVTDPQVQLGLGGKDKGQGGQVHAGAPSPLAHSTGSASAASTSSQVRVADVGKERVEALEEEHDDYVNASHVQPLGTRRRYIATQGPLEATFGDFWT